MKEFTMTELKNRYDFVLLFDAKDGNPNGDPTLAIFLVLTPKLVKDLLLTLLEAQGA